MSRAPGARAWLLLALSVGSVLAACSGTPPRAGASMPSRVAWDAMSADQKKAYMESTVLPRMRAVFAELDPHKYAKMDCVPCHTADHATLGWKMPNPDLLVSPACLEGNARSLYGSEEAAQAMTKMVAFMRERVQPEMAALLGRRPFDEATRTGFGCFDCHTLERPAPGPAEP